MARSPSPRSSASRSRASPPRGPRSPWRGRLWLLVKIVVVLLLLAIAALGVAVYIAKGELPSFDELKSSPNGQMIRVHAADGTVIVSLGPSYGEWLPYDRIPAVMRDAEIDTEDRRFYSHPGIDPIGIGRSVQVRFQRGHWVQGGSTITQQLARNVFLNSQKKFGRKFHEGILALALERKFSKEQILELYLNKVYFGGGAYGIDAASRKFFGHGADHLSLGEAAVIAGLVKAPSHYSPSADLDAAKGRAGVVLSLMRRAGDITAQQAEDADIASVSFSAEPKQNSVRYFTDWALPQLDTLIDEKDRPLEVWTTLDLGMQRDADAAIRANAPPGAQGALVSLDRDGAVRAMVGGTDYVSSIYNRATQAVRQPGSSFKLFVYLAALEAGKKPEDTEVDAPVTIAGWSPRNDSRHNSGTVTLRTAFAYSLNTVAAKLGQAVGFQTVADMARRFGITTPVNTHPSMVLGTSEVRLIDMTRAFASVANKGVATAPYGITRVTADNQVIYEYQVDRSHVLVAPYVAAEMTDLLQTAVNTGTGKAAQIGRPVAGKTGTTSANKDGWFLGFSSGITTGVWMGRDDSRPIPGLHGGTAPAKAFAAYMSKAVANRPVEQFDTQVTLPEMQIEPDDEAYGQPDSGGSGTVYVDENGNPIGQPNNAPAGDQPPAQPAPPPATETETTTTTDAPPARLDQDWIDHVTGRDRRDAPPARQRAPDPRQPVQRTPDDTY
ncbi:transglycosylase domain-containing protein [uncultured Sphingomonas sp.]|uniref:transglycosylase domain-containing protein n=1 Tax=uncultured Sphingomonas sp. TaxID=158754 RepID=UPI0035CB5CD4